MILISYSLNRFCFVVILLLMIEANEGKITNLRGELGAMHRKHEESNRKKITRSDIAYLIMGNPGRFGLGDNSAPDGVPNPPHDDVIDEVAKKYFKGYIIHDERFDA